MAETSNQNQTQAKDDSALLSAIGVQGGFPTTSEGLRDLREKILVKKGESQEETEKAKKAATTKREISEGQLYKKEAEAREPYEQALIEKGKDRPYPPPTPDNFNNFAGMFSVISALSFAVGGKGRGAGLGALSALNGAMDGYNKGQKDVFDRNMREFDKKLAEYKTSLESTRDALRIVVDRAGLSTKQGIAQLKQAELNDSGVASALIKEGKIKDAINHVDNLIRKVDSVERQNQALKDRQTMLAMREGGEGGKIRMTAAPEARLSGSRESLSAINSIETLLKDPEVAKQFDSSTFRRTLLESPKEMYSIEKLFRQSLFQSLPEKTKQLFIMIAMARNDYFRQISGQAVTGSEGARNFFATLSPSDTSATLLTKADVLKPKFVRQLQEIVDGYQLPKSTIESINEQIRQNQPKTAAPAGAATKAEPEATLNNRTIVVRNGKWVYKDTGEEAK